MHVFFLSVSSEPRQLAAMFFKEIKFFEGIWKTVHEFERQSIEKYFCENKIEIHQPVSEKIFFKN